MLVGSTLVFAGHALSCWAFDQSAGAANRQLILEGQNTAVLQSIASRLDSSASCFVGELDVGSAYAHRINFIIDRLSKNTPPELISTHRCFPPNASPGENRRGKYAAFAELGLALVSGLTSGDDLVLWPTLDTDVVITATELAALIGDVETRGGATDLTALDEVLSSLVMS